MTWGEVNEYVSCYYERERRRNKDLALMAYKTAEFTIRLLSKDKVILEDNFPYWTDEERKAIRIERLKQMLRG